MLAAVPEPLQIPAGLLISGRRSIAGWASDPSKDSEDTLKFAAMNEIRPVVEVYPLDRTGEAYQSMITGKARFRAVPQIAQ